MKALSIQQPWAWAILHAGKDWENRTWRTNYRGPLLIHAGKKQDSDGYDYLRDQEIYPPDDEIFTGGIVGAVEVVDCIEVTDAFMETDEWKNTIWLGGPFGWKLAGPQYLTFHPCRGHLGLFEPDYPMETP